jgi:hypothetical protein
VTGDEKFINHLGLDRSHNIFTVRHRIPPKMRADSFPIQTACD